jgi:hypothetical protein
MGTHAFLCVYRLVPKDGPEFEVVADPSQLKPKGDDKVQSSATNGINYFPVCWVFSMNKSCYCFYITNFCACLLSMMQLSF